jgi:4-hydroxy-tetrahydrodipicolinate synthase
MLRGSMVAMITPMTSTGAVDNTALEALVGFHIDNGTDAIVAVGTTGESATLSHAEHVDVIKRVVELVQGKIPVIAGTGSNSTYEAIELTQAAKEVGADACLLVTPYYNKPTQEGLYRHFKAIAEAVAIPQILYNVPGRTVCDMLPDTVERLSKISNIIGIKEATGNLERAKDIMQRCSSDFLALSGDDATALEFILLGGKGNISVTANVTPALMHQMCSAALSGNRAEAESLDAPMRALHSTLFVEANPIPVKWALAQMGYGHEEGIRLPLTPLSAQHHEAVRQAMRAANVQF